MSGYQNTIARIVKDALISGTALETAMLKRVYEHAQRSADPSTKVGAIILTADGSKGVGDYNGIPARCEGMHQMYADGTLARDVKLACVRHAEAGAISRAAAHGISVEGGTMYAPWACCGSCASHIINSGISRVVLHANIMLRTPERWAEQVVQGLLMLSAAGVTIAAIDCELGVTHRFNGEDITL